MVAKAFENRTQKSSEKSTFENRIVRFLDVGCSTLKWKISWNILSKHSYTKLLKNSATCFLNMAIEN
jgi:hypothetical protein